MEYIKGYPVCDNCKHSILLGCKKYDKECISMFFYPKRHQIPCLDCLDNDGFEQIDITECNKVETEKRIGYFHLPGPENLEMFESLMAMNKEYPGLFYDNREIYEIYGAFPGAIWNGRTPNFSGPALSGEQLIEIRDKIESLGLHLNLTWNNHLISGTDVYDRFCNTITEIFHNGKHAITVASPELFDYLKSKYPNYTYYSSIILTSNDTEFTKKDERFDMYLWPRNLNNNWDELNKIPDEERDKLEFLVNDACTPICNRMGHYNYVNEKLKNRFEDRMLGYCTIDHDFMLYNARRWPVSINYDSIDDYINRGYCHFKVCSRGDNPNILILKIIQYLVKPEFVLDALQWVINRHFTKEENGGNDFK